MIELAVVVLVLLAVSFLCSVLESIILSITRPYIQTLVERGASGGKLLKRLKERIDEPISAILTLNTISHTVGAAVSGALALKLFGSRWMALFSGILTLMILVFSEIIPKTLGARHWRALGPASAVILRILIIVLKPVVAPVRLLTRLFEGRHGPDRVSREEIVNFIRMGHFQGILESPEYKIMENLFRLRSIPVRDVMTPRKVVFTLPDGASAAEVISEGPLRFSRIPLLDATSGRVTGILLRRDVMDRIASGDSEAKLGSLASPVTTIEEKTSVYDLLDRMITAKIHQAQVVDGAGSFTGIVTLEDALETLLGREIVDEFDPVTDMRALAAGKREAGP